MIPTWDQFNNYWGIENDITIDPIAEKEVENGKNDMED